MSDRPWRKLGAVICVVLGVMFPAGVLWLDAKRAPGLYLLYWLVMMVLVAWVFGLAVKDVLHTRRLLTQWRNEQAHERRKLRESCTQTARTDVES